MQKRLVHERHQEGKTERGQASAVSSGDGQPKHSRAVRMAF